MQQSHLQDACRRRKKSVGTKYITMLIENVCVSGFVCENPLPSIVCGKMSGKSRIIRLSRNFFRLSNAHIKSDIG